MLKYIAKYGRFIGIILFIIILTRINRLETLTFIGKIDFMLFFFAVTMFPLFVLLKAIRWKVLLKGQGVDYPLKSCFMVYLSSNFLGVLTPSRIGEMSKILYLKQEKNISYSRGLSSVFLDRLFDLFILFIIACIGILTFFTSYRFLTLLIIAIAAGIIILVRFNMSRLDRLLKVILYKMNYRKTYRRIKIFFLSLMSLNRTTMFYSLFLSIIGIAVYFFICNLLALSLHLKHGIFIIPFSISIANIVSLIPISISGIGVRDMVLIVVLGKAGYSPEMALSFSVLFFFYFTGLWAFLGWIAWNIKPVPFPKNVFKEKAF